ncbi:MAG TPA: malto-oligosyltrehalose synthase, partial [Burkholderiales bacterium]|nr:malto-oligosyltrehalose synthase [Burkholderiales bacterium]
GNDPRDFGFSLKAFHAASEDRAKHWPYTMLGSSTHDTKRSEDARARIGVLSEMSSAWRLQLRRWHVANRSRRTEVGGESWPTRGDEYHFYQALLGVWPLEKFDLEDLKLRLKTYMLKAVREAKLRTSWVNPDTEYEAALERFVVQSLDNPVFVKEVNDAVAQLAHLGMLVGLSQALIKVASPGVPDYYQGTELWDFSLVDPDNRRPVDYGVRRKFLDKAEEDPRGLLHNIADGRAKLHVIRKGLEVRRAHPRLFHGGKYTPLHADGGREENIVAFSLSQGRSAVIAVAPRLFAGFVTQDEPAPLGARAWGKAQLPLPEGAYRNVLTGEAVNGGPQPLSSLLSRFPVALLTAS